MRQLTHILVLLALLMLGACGAGGHGDTMAEWTDTVYRPAHATGFVILGAPGRQSTIIETFTPWQGADSTARTRLMIARGGEEPPAGFDGQVVRGDASHIVCLSSTHVAMLEAVGALDRVAGASGVQYLTGDTLSRHLPHIAEVGYEGCYDYEALVGAGTDLVLLYGISGASPIEPKLRELGIPYAYVGEYLEPSPLGKAEWMVAVAEMAGLRERGEAAFGAIVPRYQALRDLAATVSGRPGVMLNTPYADSWVMPPVTGFMATLIADAGGRYLYTPDPQAPPTTESVAVDLEEAYRMAMQADVWLGTGQIYTLRQLRTRFPRFAACPPVARGEVWNTSADYWQSGVVSPDVVLRDMIVIFHPELLPGQSTTYYQRLP